MNLQQAIEELKAGKALHRKGWDLQDGYVVLMNGMDHVWKIVLKPTPNAGNYIFSFADLVAEDWLEFELGSEAREAIEVEAVAEAAA